MALSDEDIREILRIIDESPLEELQIETEGFSLHVRKGSGAAPAAPAAPTAPGGPTAPAAPGAAPGAPAAPTPDPDPDPPAVDPPPNGGALTIDAPMLGTFYRAESPGESPFVEVGSQIEPDTTVGIIEVMKMMNSISAGVAGTIVEVCSQDAELVESGQPLFRVEPA